MSANGSATTANEKPKPPASASIDAEYARAPSGASSITAIPATVTVVLTQARCSICATVKISIVGAIAEIPHATAEPTTPRRIARRRPRRSASAVAKIATIAPARVSASATLSLASETPNVSAMGSASWPNNALANDTTATAADADASNNVCSWVKGTVGSPIDARRRFGLRAALEVVPQFGERVLGGAVAGDPGHGLEEPTEERDVDGAAPACSDDRARRVGRHRHHGGERVAGCALDRDAERAVVGDDRAESRDGRGAYFLGRRGEPSRRRVRHTRGMLRAWHDSQLATRPRCSR